MKQYLKTEETHLFTKGNIIGTGHTLFCVFGIANHFMKNAKSFIN